jgi:hypothetical protein
MLPSQPAKWDNPIGLGRVSEGKGKPMKTNHSVVRRALLAAALAFLPALTAGCLIAADSHETTSGIKVSDATFNRIKPNETSEEWVRATLGPATTDTSLKDGGRIMKWTYTEKHESSGAVFLIFGGHSEKKINHTAYVEVHNGVVTNAWRE